MVGVVLGDGYYGDGGIGNQCGGDGDFGYDACSDVDVGVVVWDALGWS